MSNFQGFRLSELHQYKCLGSSDEHTSHRSAFKMRQAQWVVRMSAKHEDDQIREEFNTWI